MLNTHESLFIESFILKDKQDRYFQLLDSKNGRIKFRHQLSHFKDFNEKTATTVSLCGDFKKIFFFLTSKNAPKKCHCICEVLKYDKKELILFDALEILYGSGISFILSCIPGKLAYYEGEDINQIIFHN